MPHKKIKQKKGLTLTELLVSVVLIGIVMIGVVAFNFAVNQVERSSSKKSLLSLETAAAISHMARNAALAVGFSANPGVITSLDANKRWFSFRQDADNDPSNYTNDSWIIYICDDTSHPNTLRTCTQTAAQTSTPNTATTCSFANSTILSEKIINTSFALVTDSSSGNLTISLNIGVQARYTPTSAVDPINNPEVVIETTISPKGHSW